MALGTIENLFREYELILCKPDKTPVSNTAYIDFSDLTYSPRYDSVDELEFEISYRTGWRREINPNFDTIKAGYLVLMYIKQNDSTVHSQYFTIIEPNPNENDGIFKKRFSCKSLEYQIFSTKTLRGYKDKGSQLLYDINGDNGIINFMLKQIYNSWSVGGIDTKYIDIPHTFTFDKNSFLDVFYQLEKEYNCKILFDTIDNKINIVSPSNYTNTGIIFSDTNYIKSISMNENLNSLITKLYVYGKDTIGINKYNPTGRSYIEDYSYYVNNGYTSPSFATAWNNYVELVNSVSDTFTTYISQVDEYNTQITIKNSELKTLKIELKAIDVAMDTVKNDNTKNNSTYDSLVIERNNKQTEINNKELEINNIITLKNDVETNITILQETLSYESNFTTSQLQELVNYIHDDPPLEMSSVSDEKLLYQYATEYLALKSQLPLNFDIDSIDIFDSKECQFDWNKISVGNFAYIDCPELGYNYYPIRLISYSHNPFSNSLSFSFSNTNELITKETELNKIFMANNQATNTVEVNKDDYGKYVQDKDSIIFNGDTIDTSESPIVAGNNVINHRGFTGTDIGSNGAIQLLNDKIIFSKDNWITFFTMLSGNGLHLETSDGKYRVLITPDKGFQIDKWDVAANTWDNVVYLDNEGHFTIDGGWIEILSADNRKRLKLNPEVGFSVSKNIGTTQNPNWTDVFILDSNGNVNMRDAIVQGVFKTGLSGARVEIDNNGIKSYNSINKPFGLFINPTDSYVDLLLYNNTDRVFEVLDGVTDTSLILYNKYLVTYNRGEDVFYLLGKLNFSGADSIDGLDTNSVGNHDHGIPNGTKLAIVDDALNITGYITFSSGGIHYHNVKKAT